MNQRFRAKVKGHSLLLAGLTGMWIAVLAVPVAASSPDGKGEPERQAPKAVAEPADPSTVADQTTRVVIDPETGEIIARAMQQPTGALSPEVAKALSRSTEGLHVFDLANGGKGVDLEGRFQHVLMVRVKPDGSFETVCVNHQHEVEKFLQRKSAEDDPVSRDR